MKTKNLSCSAARSRIDSGANGVAWITVRGPVTPTVLQRVRDDVMEYAPKPTWAWGANLQGAMVAFEGMRLDAMLNGVRPSSSLAQPGAMVVAPEVLDMFHGHAWRMAARGIVRRVFTSLCDAQEWTAQQAQLRQDQDAWELRRRAAGLPA